MPRSKMKKNLPGNKQPKIVLIGEAANILGVSIDTVRRWDKAGKLHSVRPDGKNRYFAVSELEKINGSKGLGITEAASTLGISASTLRRYEKKGLIYPKRNEKGDRIYAQETLNQLSTIKNTPSQTKEPPSKLVQIKRKKARVFVKPKIVKKDKKEINIRIPIPTLDIRNLGAILPEKRPTKAQIALVTFITFTSLLSYMYVRDNKERYKNQAKSRVTQVLGVADTARGFFGKITDIFTTTNHTLISQIRSVVSPKAIVDINDIFEYDEEGNIVPKVTINITQPELLKIKETIETKVVQNLNAESVQGRVPGEASGDLAYFGANGTISALRVGVINLTGGITGGLIADASIALADLATDAVDSSKILNGTIVNADIADNAINSAKIEDGVITSSDINDGTITSADISNNTIDAGELSATLTFASGDFLDLSAITHTSTSQMGLLLPNVSSASPSAPSTGEGYIAYDTAGNQALVFNGSSWEAIGGGVSLYTTADDDTTTSSVSGLQLLTDELSLIRGCADTQVLKWNDTAKTWECGNDSGAGGAGISTVQENNVTIVSSATQIDFSNDFTVTDNGGGEAGLAIDYTNSGVVRKGQGETVSGAWSFSNGVTFTGNITANDTSADTILIGQNGTTDDTVTIAGNISLTDDDWSISATGVAAGLSGITADDLSCTNCIGPTEITDLTLGTDTAGNYVATLTSGSGISSTATGEGSTPTISLSALTANWSQTGAYDIVLQNAASELQILESTGATYYGTLDVGDLVANATYTFSGTSGTVLTSANVVSSLSGWDQDSSDDLTTSTSFSGDVGGNYNSLAITANTVTEADLKVVDTPADEECLTYESTGGDFEWQACGGGGGGAWSDLTDPTANLSLAAAEYTSAIAWNTAASSAAYSGLTLSLTNDASTDGGSQNILVLDNADDAGATGTTEALLLLDNSDTNEAVTAGIQITNAGGGFTKLLDSPSLDISGAGAVSGATGISSSGTITFSGLTNCNTIDTDASGNLSCGTDEGGGGGGIVTIKEDNVNITTSATVIDFLGADFTVTDSPAGEGNVVIDYTNSGITRKDQNEAITGDWSFTLAGTESLDVASDLAGTVNALAITGTPSASAGTAYGLYIDQADSANTNGLDAALVVDNSDTDLAVADGILFVSAGGAITDAIDVSATQIVNAINIGSNNIVTGATTLASTELDILDSGILLSELTDTGTLTAGTVDINGGAIDGVTIGGASAGSGTFTTLTGSTSVSTPTLSLSGTGTINGLDSIDATTETTLESAIDIAGDVSGTGLTSVTIGADKVLESHLKAVDVAADEECLTYEATVGDFEWQTCGGGGGASTLDEAYNGGTATITVDAYNITLGLNDATNDYGFVIDNTTAGDIATAFTITSSGVGATTATAIDISDADIVTALALGSNDVTVGGATISSAEFSLLDSGVLLSELTDTGTLTAGTVDINGGAIDGVTIGGASAGAGSFTTIGATGAISGATATNTINGLIINSGALSGISTIGLSGAISGATATNTINGIVINSGAVSGVSTLSTSGAISAPTSTNTINGLIVNSGALSGISTIGLSGAISGGTTLGLSGAISGATATNTINGLVINSGAVSGATTIAATNTTTIGSGGNTFTFDPSAGPTYAGTARPTKRVTISPEFEGASITGDGTNNTGTMTSDNMTSTPYRNYYNWTTSQGTSQDYDIWIRVPLPADFDAMASGNAIVVETWSDSLANTTATIDVFDTSNASDCTGVSIETTTVNTWEDATPTGCTGGTYAANGIMTIQIKLGSVSSSNIRLGRIYFDYEAKF